MLVLTDGMSSIEIKQSFCRLLLVMLKMLDLTDRTRSMEITQCLLQVELNMLEITDGTRSIEIRQRLYVVCYKENID